MNLVYQIQPITLQVTPTISNTVTQLVTSVDYAVGMTEMQCQIFLQDASCVTYYNGVVTITEAELANWGTDDDYIIRLIAQKAGVTLL